jgi:hypothetical protein
MQAFLRFLAPLEQFGLYWPRFDIFYLFFSQNRRQDSARPVLWYRRGLQNKVEVLIYRCLKSSQALRRRFTVVGFDWMAGSSPPISSVSCCKVINHRWGSLMQQDEAPPQDTRPLAHWSMRLSTCGPQVGRKQEASSRAASPEQD